MKKALLMVMMLMLFGAAGAEPALTVGETTLSDGEVRACAMAAGESYRETAEYYEQYLHIDFWSLEYPGGISMEQSIASDVFRQLLMTCTLCEKAREDGITLTEQDRESCAENASSWCEGFEDCGFTGDDVQSLYEKQLLAGREYALLVLNTDVDLDAVRQSLDPADWTVYTVSYLYTVSKDPDVQSEMLESEDFDRTAEADARLSAGILVLDSESTDALLTVAQGLSEGECSGIINTEYGAFVIKLESTSEEAYDTVYSMAVYEAREKAFESQYNALLDGTEYIIHDSFRSALVLR